MAPRRVLPLAAVLGLVALILAGCGGGSSGGGAPAMDSQDVKATESTTAREIVRTAYVTLEAEDVPAAVSAIETAARGIGGRVSQQQVSDNAGTSSASIVVRVPAAQLDSYLEGLRDLGRVTGVNVTDEDVTLQGIDLDARISSLETSVARLQELLASSTSTATLIEVERELAARQAELESLRQQRTALTDAVELSTVTVSVGTGTLAPDWAPPGFVAGVTSGMSALRTVLGIAVTAAGFLVPFAIALLVVAAPIVAVIVVVRRRRRPPAGP